MITGRLPSVPEYFAEHINSEVDLVAEPKQCCPFHKENTPSFSYNIATGRWSCFGQCHAHGDVIEMHRRYFHYSTREEAEKDLNIRYMVPKVSTREKLLMAKMPPIVSEEKIQDEAIYVEACMLANTVERWLELDYQMSKTPFDRNALYALVNSWKGVKSVFED